jgi:hypothetical protein
MNDRYNSIVYRGVLAVALLVAAVLLPATPAAATIDGELAAGGNFTQAGGVTVNRVAGWDGVDWSALTGPSGTGVDGSVFAFTEFEGQLIAGGSFINAGGIPVSGIAAWDGTQWSPLVGASGIRGVTVSPLGFVSSLQVYNGDLYVAGAFPRAGGTLTVNNIVRWDGTEWFALNGPTGPGVGFPDSAGVVWDLTVHDGELVVAGEFSQAGGVAVNSIASWDGSGWSSLDMPPLESLTVLSVAEYQGELVAGNHYVDDNVSFRQIYRRDGGVWSALSGPGGGDLDGDIRALTVFGGDLYAGGGFSEVGGVTVNGVVRWDGTDWAALTGSSGTGVNSLARTFAVFDGDLYVGGHFTQAGGLTVNGVARWDGAEWAPLVAPGGTGANDAVFALLAT